MSYEHVSKSLEYFLRTKKLEKKFTIEEKLIIEEKNFLERIFSFQKFFLTGQ